MEKRRIDFVTVSPLLLIALLPVGASIHSYFTTSAAHPEVAFFKYFAIPLIGFSLGSIIFLGVVRNDWNMPHECLSFIEKHLGKIILAISITFFICFSALAVLRYTSLHTSVFDMGLYDKKIWQISVAPLVDIPYKITFGHFQPILIFYSLIYKIIDSPVIIQVLQAAVMTSGVIPLYLMAKQHLNNAGLTFLVAIVYLLYPSVGFNASLDFHPDHLYVSLTMWAFYFAEKDKYFFAILFVSVGAMAKEPLILGASFFGLYIALAKKQHRIGMTAFVFFLLLFFTVVYIILPSANQLPTFAESYGENTNAFNMKSLMNILLMAKVRKSLFIYFLLAPLLFLPLLDWKRFLPAAPLIVIPLLSTTYLHSALDSQYTAGIIAPAFVASIFSLKKLKGYFSMEYVNAVAVLVVVMTLTFHIAHGPSPLSINFWKSGWAEIWHKSNYTSGEHEEVIKEAIYKIPGGKDIVILSQGNVNHSRLAHRYNNKYLFPDSLEDADYILLDTNRPLMMAAQVDEQTYVNLLGGIRNSPEFYVEFERDGVVLFKRVAKESSD